MFYQPGNVLNCFSANVTRVSVGKAAAPLKLVNNFNIFLIPSFILFFSKLRHGHTCYSIDLQTFYIPK